MDSKADMENMNSFSFDVPFFDFTENTPNDNVKNTEAFFEAEHANHNGLLLNEFNVTAHKEIDGEEKFYSVSPRGNQLRRSISVGVLRLEETEKVTEDLININQDLEKLNLTASKTPIYRNKRSSVMKPKYHAMTTRADAHNLTNRAKTVSSETLNNVEEQKPNATVNRYVSMAEAINLFHQKTPSRFHSHSKTHVSRMVKMNGPKSITIPHSPALQTKLRVRSTSAMSREEKETKDLEEAKKHQIKANPINPKILNTPLALTLAKKAPTKQEPFNLTQVPLKKVIANSPKRRTEFLAQPVPKSVLEPPQPLIKSNLYTIPLTPKFMRRKAANKPNETVIECKSRISEVTKLAVTKPVPFSFEQRDKDLVKKRVQLLNEVLKEEQKAREFHAKPIAKKVAQMGYSKHNLTLPPGHSMHKAEDKASDNFTFKARPATVVHMKPFVPKKEERTLIEITEFKLNTDIRAQERNQFEQRKKELEEQKIINIQQQLKLQVQREQEEVAKLRKDAEVKANPIRRYKELKPASTKQLTAPKSPKFLTDRIKNKENTQIN